MTPVLRRLALERDGVVESFSPVLMPKQRFLQAGAAVEVSSAPERKDRTSASRIRRVSTPSRNGVSFLDAVTNALTNHPEYYLERWLMHKKLIYGPALSCKGIEAGAINRKRNRAGSGG